MTPCSCGKRQFPSRHAVKAAHAGTGFRVRAYECPEHKGWHGTNQDKHGTSTPPPRIRRRRGPKPERVFPPFRSLAEVEALAAAKRAAR